MKKLSFLSILFLFVCGEEEFVSDGEFETRYFGVPPEPLPSLVPFTCRVKISENTMHRNHFLYSLKGVWNIYDCVGYCFQYNKGPEQCRAVNYFTKMGGCDLLSKPSQDPSSEPVPPNMAWINIRHVELVECQSKGTASPSVPPQTNECGKPFFQPNLRSDTRVVNGDEAVPHSFPWVVSIVYFGKHICGGSLIPVAPGLTETDMVLTAAHCLKDDSIGELDITHLSVVVGLHSLSDQQGSETIPVESVDWFDYYMSQNYMNDVALIKLKEPVKFNENVSTICLPNQRDPTLINSICVTAGWGRNEGFDNGNLADKLQQLVVPIIDSTTCKDDSVWGSRVNPNTMICAGELSGKQNVCRGDSGGALICLKDDRWVQHGVTSFVYRQDCTAPNKPAVYTRVSMYRFWIDKMIRARSSVLARNPNAT